MNWNTLLARSYVPYSGRHEACVVEGKSGSYYAGVRIENIAFPDTISAMQVALFTCLSEHDKPVKLILRNNAGNDHDLVNFWQEEYNLSVTVEDHLPELPFFQNIYPLKSDINKLLENLLNQAVVPNSDFPVSALIETYDGFISGVNMECSEWRFGLCAERMAIAKAVTMGYEIFDGIHIHTKYGEYSSPCGACRQVIIEHLPDKPVHLYHADKTHSIHSSSHLLPNSFQSKKLKNLIIK
jgi:homotetrameric cytidine deaminase